MTLCAELCGWFGRSEAAHSVKVVTGMDGPGSQFHAVAALDEW